MTWSVVGIDFDHMHAHDLLAQAQVEYDGAQASLTFGEHTRYDRSDQTYVAGTEGAPRSDGVDLQEQTVTLETADGVVEPSLEGGWYNDGFQGTMAELLRAVEADREPSNSGRDNLRSLELCFAAVASAECGEPVAPGEVTRLPDSG